MDSEAPVVDWDNILDKFSSYKGTIKAFCKENNISVHQLYYRRKRLKNNNKTVFHAVSFKSKDSNQDINHEATQSSSSLTSNIKIEIGKAKIYVASNDNANLSNIIKALMESC